MTGTKPKLAAKAAVAVLALLLTVSPSLPLSAAGGGAGTGQNVKIFSVNICIDQDNIDERGTRMLDLIKSYDPDTVGTQENGMPSYSKWPGIFENGLEGYGRVGLDDGGGHNSPNQGSNYIYYNESRIECLDWQTFWMSDTTMVMGSTYPMPWAYAVTWGLFRIRETGLVFAHVNCHLSASSADEVAYQVRFVEKITSHFAESGIPVFTTGDFNTSEGGGSYGVMVSGPYVSDSKYVAAKTADIGTWRGWSDRPMEKGYVIDFCFVSDSLMDVNEYSVVDTKSPDGVILSDHRALFVEASLHPQQAGFPSQLDSLSMEGSEVRELRKSTYVYDFEFSAPDDRRLTYFYRAELYDADGGFVDSRKIWSLIFDREPPGTRTCTFCALNPDTEYIVKIYACTAGGQYSEPLVFSFRTLGEW